MVKYELRSKPGVAIEIPDDYAKAAEKIVRRSTMEETRELGLASLLKKEGCLEDKRVFSAAMELGGVGANNEEYPALRDRLYLEVCMYEAMQRGAFEQLHAISRVLFEVMRDINIKEASAETFRESIKNHLDDCIE